MARSTKGRDEQNSSGHQQSENCQTNEKASLKWSRSLVQTKTSQILTIQDCLPQTIMLPSSGSAFFVCLYFTIFPICTARWTSKRRMWPWNSHIDCIARCEQSGCHHFIGWQHILLTYISGEGITCLQILKCRNLTIVFHKNTASLMN